MKFTLVYGGHIPVYPSFVSQFSEFNVILIGRGYPIVYNNRDGKVNIFDREIEAIIM